MSLWKTLVTTLRDAWTHAFSSFAFYIIVGKEVDDLTKRAVFSIREKRTPTLQQMKTIDIISSQSYMMGLSPADRSKILQQYADEARQPLAYIEEYPISADENNEYIFKVILIEEQKVVCGSATYFVHEGVKLLELLGSKDAIRIGMAYNEERFYENQMAEMLQKRKSSICRIK